MKHIQCKSEYIKYLVRTLRRTKSLVKDSFNSFKGRQSPRLGPSLPCLVLEQLQQSTDIPGARDGKPFLEDPLHVVTGDARDNMNALLGIRYLAQKTRC